jgi:hypothetical protein
LATRSGAAPRIDIYSPDVGNTLEGFASHWRLFARRWQHARGLHLTLASIRPALATRLGASSRIGVFLPGVSNTLGGYSNNGFFCPGKSEPLLHLIVGFRSQVISDSGPAVPQIRFGSSF